MLTYLALAIMAAAIALISFWYVQTRNVEIAPYRTLEADGGIEIRDYPPLVVAEVTRPGTRDEAVRAGFGPLARYIFASDREGEKIAMTAPVTQTPEGTGWAVRFVMPSGLPLDRLPRPAGAEVKLAELPAARRAAIRFSGWWSDELFEQKNTELLGWLTRKGLSPLGDPTFAYYNDPFTPGFLRRNEILYDLAP
jgi:hypothetical protein